MNQSNPKDEENVRITEKDLPQEFVLKLLGQYEAKGLWGIKHTREPVDTMVKYAKTHELSLPIVQVVVTKEGIFMSPIQCRLDTQTKEDKSIRRIQSMYAGRKFTYPKTPPEETWNKVPIGPQPKPRNVAQNLLKIMKDNYIECENKKKDNYNCRTEDQTKSSNLGRFTFVDKQEKKKVIPTPTDLHLLEAYSRFDWRKNGIFFFGIDTISYGVQDLIYTRVFSMIVINDRKKKNSVPGNSPFMCHAFVCESRSTAKRVTYALAAAFQSYGRSMKTIGEITPPQRTPQEEKPRKFTIELRSAIEVACNDSEA